MKGVTLKINSAETEVLPKNRKLLRRILMSWQLYVMLLPAVIYLIIFNYIPMYGVQIAFKNFRPSLGIWDSKWVGFEHFMRFFNSPSFLAILKNTLLLSIYSLAASFPIPILLALAMNSVENKFFKKSVQTITYAPHFISTVVIVGMLSVFLSETAGVANVLMKNLGFNAVGFLTKPDFFRSLYVWSGVWQNMGWSSIIYLAALSSVDPELIEASIVDGANKLKRIWYIDIPCILPTIIMLLILNTGKIMSVGFEKVFLMQNPLNLTTAEVISTYVYKRGLVDSQYSFATAVGLFNSIINIILLSTVNKISKKVSETSLW